MKVTLNWLKQYVDFDWSPGQLSERLTMIGIEVEGVRKLDGEFEGIVVAQVLTRDKVAGSDKLSVCRVTDGARERQVICGAQNFKAGDKVAMILPDFALPMKPGDKAPFVIKVRKVMGVESQGMLCSPEELGLPDKVDGILILPPDAKLGQPFAEYLGRASGDVVYDLEITPNRPDLNSVIGIAREISAVTGNLLRIPNAELPAPSSDSAESLVSVRIEDAELCPRYAARVVRGVKVGPSPDWLRTALEKVNIRSISNVVDVTNFVMLEIGQPLHAFDYHLISRGASGKPTIVIRRATEGERFKTLDNVERALTNQNLLIADESKAIALAGVMGGQNTEINDRTTDVLIESAYFNPQNIRATSRKLEIRTESSYRFERGGDVGICDWASRRAAQLILQTAGGQLAAGVVDSYAKPAPAVHISLRFPRTDQLLGITIPPERQVEFLRRLDLHLDTPPGVAPSTGIRTPFTATFAIPSFRVDLKQEADLIEEIARMHGIENIPSTPPRGAIGSHSFDAVHDELAAARRILIGLGLDEAQGQTLVSDKSAGVDNAAGTVIPLANPLSSDMNVLRPSLLPGLLDSLRHNLHHKNGDVALFEIGSAFNQNAGQQKEERRLAIALTGARSPVYWSGGDRDAKFDIYDLKGVLDEFFDAFGLRGFVFSRRSETTGIFLESAAIQLGKQTLGEIGQLSPAVARRYDLRDAVVLAELNFDLLLARRNPDRRFKSLPAFPAIRRDIAMLVPEATTHDSVLLNVKQAKLQDLENVQLFDVFRGKNIPTGQKSMAYAFTYRSPERTLTDAEVNAAHEKLVAQFKQQLQAVIRES